MLGQLRQGAGSPFAAAIGERYRRGVGWLIAIDAPAVVTMAAEDDAPPIALAGMIGMKYVFLEQRAPAGALENEVTFAFQKAQAVGIEDDHLSVFPFADSFFRHSRPSRVASS